MIGILTYYARHEVTRAAIRLASLFRANGLHVEIHAVGNDARAAIDPYWDRHVHIHGVQRFTEWAPRCNAVIWLDRPQAWQVKRAKKRSRTLAVLPWEWLPCLDRHCVRAYQACDHVVSPSTAGHTLLAGRLHFKNSIAIPWDTGARLTYKRPQDKPGVQVCFPLHDDQPMRTDPIFIDVVRFTLREHPWVEAFVTWSPNQTHPPFRRHMRQLAREFPSRLRLLTNPSRDEVLLAYGKADLTVWLATFDSFGAVGIDSLTMGTPVMAFAVEPAVEYLDNNNGIILRTEASRDEHGMRIATPNYAEAMAKISDAVQSPAKLQALSSQAATWLAQRRDSFDRWWLKLANG